MASNFTHAFVGAAAAAACLPARQRTRFVLLAAGCSCLPDLDVVMFRFGVSYDHMLGHRGLFHSLPFAAMVAVAVTTLAFRDRPIFSAAWWRFVAFFFIVTGSHGLLDMLTDGGKGVALFAPFDNSRYFFGWRPIRVSPIGIGRFFSSWGAQVIMTELHWVWLPTVALCTAIFAGRWWWRLRAHEKPGRGGPG